ncbi:MAG: hypothetical protein R3D70_14085 [Rhizobiaceae bacterium]
MKHRKGIDLLAGVSPSRYEDHIPTMNVMETISGLRNGEVLGARCGECGNVAWLDRDKVFRRIGNQFLRTLKLVCRCGNRKDNKVLIGRLG